MTQRIRKCSIDGCENNHRARGWCSTHYNRWAKHGDPHATLIERGLTLEEKFLSEVEWRGDCLLWVGAKDHEGYGRVNASGERVSAHRYAWQRIHGPIPDGMKVDHKLHCDVSCCNVDHLRLATNAQNMANRPGAQANSKSGVRNVMWNKADKKWWIQIKKNGKRHHFGRYSTIEEAAAVAERARRELFGEFAGRG